MTGSTTRRDLLRLRAVLLVVTGLVVAASWFVVRDVHDRIGQVLARGAPAVLEATAAHAALAEADAFAIDAFDSGEAKLAGPGDRYQNRIAVASQSLTRVAEHNVAAAEGSRQIQLVEGLLVAYTGWIAQADAHYRQRSTLADVDLWYASRLVHAPGIGVLAELDQLARVQREALDRQLGESLAAPVWIGLLAVAALVLGVRLVLAQRYLRRRFRRRWNVPLLLGCGALLGLCAVVVFGVLAQYRAEVAAGELRGVTDAWAQRAAVAGDRGQRELRGLVTRTCERVCGETVDRFVAGLPAVPRVEAVAEHELTTRVKAVNERIAAADRMAGVEPLVPVAGVLVLVAVWSGFRPRLAEYRYEPR
ncbi:hypothetical protein [Saccharothrix violaceirubra]|uniref:Uncharacterized protein n=1 Tax=Saccharothrix violaceirubra TaxID=413306 RepID=A0A7W7WWR3_9PSEU|nr:hypothetical protein [Saccharothrix violaceirubra]MBB4966664.1 hypothetical protein [Saccharothrix violaceirubra]